MIDPGVHSAYIFNFTQAIIYAAGYGDVMTDHAAEHRQGPEGFLHFSLG